MSYIPRHYTLKLLGLMEDGLIDELSVAEMCLRYMSEADVQDMMRHNDLLWDEDEEEDEEDD